MIDTLVIVNDTIIKINLTKIGLFLVVLTGLSVVKTFIQMWLTGLYNEVYARRD